MEWYERDTMKKTVSDYCVRLKFVFTEVWMLQVPAALGVFLTRPIKDGVSVMTAWGVRSYLNSRHWKKRTSGSKRFWQSLNWIS